MQLNHLTFTLLGLASLGLADLADLGRRCGLKIVNCPADMTCVPDSADCADLSRCLGTCAFTNKYPSCGGFTPEPHFCEKDATCQDDPRKPGNCGMACDMPGICIPTDAPSCGGFVGKACPKGLFCYDALNDDCDPTKGGADCMGICV